MSSNNFSPTQAAPAAESDTTAVWRELTQRYDPTRHITPVVAHELNNLLTIVQGYSERLLLHHGGDPTLKPQLTLISEASKSAAAIIRQATPPSAGQTLRKNSQPAQADA